jgi:hypothetical protein
MNGSVASKSSRQKPDGPANFVRIVVVRKQYLPFATEYNEIFIDKNETIVLDNAESD